MAENWNSAIIEEFRANGGKVEGYFDGAPLPKAGADTNPDWFWNLLAQPRVTVEVGTQTREAVARVAEGAERTRLWEAQKSEWPGFADYEKRTDRQIPVVILEPVS